MLHSSEKGIYYSFYSKYSFHPEKMKNFLNGLINSAIFASFMLFLK